MSDVLSTLEDPRAADALDADERRRMRELVTEVEADPRRISVVMPAAARTVARGPLDPEDPSGLLGPTLDDLVRCALLGAYVRGVAEDPQKCAGEVAALYRYGDAEEKRAVLRALHLLPVGAASLPLVHDALRTNDLRLVAAALGPYATKHLDIAAWRHGVLKCLFVGVPLAAVDGLELRKDTELNRMVSAFVEERRAAGRDLPNDVWLLLDRPAPDLQES